MQRTQASRMRLRLARRIIQQRLFFLPLAAFSASFLAPSSALATQFTRWENRREAPKTFRLIPEIQILSTSSNYDAQGKESTPSGLDYSKTLLDFHLLHGFNSRATGFARLSLVSVSYKTPSLKGSGFGLGDQALGFNYRLFESQGGYAADRSPKRRTQVDGQIQIELPLYDKAGSRRSNPRNPLLGDGTFDITFGPFVTHPLNQGRGNRLYLIGGLALMIRNSGFSSAIPYQLSIATQPESSGLFGRLGIYGLQSLSSDNTDIALDEGAIVQDSGGSLIVDAKNSSYLSGKLLAGYQFNAANQIHFGYQKTLQGKSTANLSAMTFAAQFRFGGGSRKNTRGADGKPNGKRKALNYDLQGVVTQTQAGVNTVRVNLGESDGVARGNVIDLYRTHPDGTPADLIARGLVTEVRSSECVVQIRQYAKQVVVQNGFVAKRLVR